MRVTEPATTVLADMQRRRADRARQVADCLRRQVLHGRYPAGVLPSEALLVEEFGASRNTVRVALDLLRTEGLVERCPGVGTVVCQEKYFHGLDRLQGLAETLHKHGPVVNEVRTSGLISPPAAVADRTGSRSLLTSPLCMSSAAGCSAGSR
jgi:GntR family transcriptional regulator